MINYKFNYNKKSYYNPSYILTKNHLDKINNKDIWGPLLWIYASMELENGNTKKANEFFERARERGTRKFMIMQMLRNEEAAEKLTKSLESLGSLD